MDANIARCESILHTFTDKVICARALNTYPCVLTINGHHVKLEHNSRLAIYGDVVATSSLGRRWWERGLTNGQWTTVRSVLNNANLARVGFRNGLQSCINLNPGTRQVSPATMATTLEALLAAVYMDGGEEALGAVMDRLGLVHPLIHPVWLERVPMAAAESRHESANIPANPFAPNLRH